jgi:hypothetical protein
MIMHWDDSIAHTHFTSIRVSRSSGRPVTTGVHVWMVRDSFCQPNIPSTDALRNRVWDTCASQ